MISPPPLQVPIAAPTGGLTAAWISWFDQLRRTVSDDDGELTSAPDSVSSLASAQAALATVEQALSLPPIPSFGTLAYQNSENAFVTRLSTVDATTGVRNGTLTENSGFVTLLGTNGAVTGIGSTGITVTQLTGFRPFLDNVYNLGTGPQRWYSIYATELLLGATQQAKYKEDSGFALITGDNGVVTGIGSTGITVTQLTGFRPFLDDTYNLGTGVERWNTVYATVGTINTSDATEKQQIETLTDAERRVAQRIKSLVRTFKWNSAVELKGDAARKHVGVMAQDVQAAFEAEGLDAHKYALFCSDDIPSGDGTVTARLGLRYDQLLTFVISTL